MSLVPVVSAFVFDMLAIEERRNYLRFYNRQLRDEQNPFELPGVQFKSMFRLNKNLVNFLIEELQPHIPSRMSVLPLHLKASFQIPSEAVFAQNTMLQIFEIQVLTTLKFLSSGSYQNCVGSTSYISVSQPSVSKCITQVCKAITNHLMPVWVKFPETIAEQSEVKRKEKDEDQAVIQFKKRVLVATGISNHKSIKKKLSTPSKPRTFSGGEEQAIRRIKLSTNIMAPKKRPTLNVNAFLKWEIQIQGTFSPQVYSSTEIVETNFMRYFKFTLYTYNSKFILENKLQEPNKRNKTLDYFTKV
ncbi:hypothetical protein TcasGA2_TC002318 [Tribolium castaneum]|uniref:Nuclease HARBI1 n=1 Tax=Tribolium castaneum TaxID=7070 RepID=D7EHV8_TRICA|nr:hypothetical protein TcasGA2_TC002318 [Tribolium castaneum]